MSKVYKNVGTSPLYLAKPGENPLLPGDTSEPVELAEETERFLIQIGGLEIVSGEGGQPVPEGGERQPTTPADVVDVPGVPRRGRG